MVIGNGEMGKVAAQALMESRCRCDGNSPSVPKWNGEAFLLAVKELIMANEWTICQSAILWSAPRQVPTSLCARSCLRIWNWRRALFSLTWRFQGILNRRWAGLKVMTLYDMDSFNTDENAGRASGTSGGSWTNRP